MDIPNLKEKANKALDGLNGTPIGIIQIAVTEIGHTAVLVGGVPEILKVILANAMEQNGPLKQIFEDAYCKITKTPE